jgi:protein TIF31
VSPPKLGADVEPYSDFTARQSVLRLVELIAPAGTSAHTLSAPFGLIPGATIFETVRDGTATSSSEPIYQEVEVTVPSGRKGKAGKKEVIKVKRDVAQDTTNPFADWKPEWETSEYSKLALFSPPIEVQPSLRAVQVSPFNPPSPYLRQQGHQLYLQVTLLEGETLTLVCTARGWYVSKSNVNNFDPTPRSEITHSLIDLIHSLSPLFSERISLLQPLSTTPPPFEPISTVPVPQTEPAYSFLAPIPKPAASADVLRTQLAYLHTGASTADALDSARDWNEEFQGIKELQRESIQERVLREKMAQKTWAEFTQASIRAVLAISVSTSIGWADSSAAIFPL